MIYSEFRSILIKSQLYIVKYQKVKMLNLQKISVVTIINPGTRFYVTAVKSFMYQTYKNAEWIVIDNSGKNLIGAKFAKYEQKDERIRFFENPIVLRHDEVLKQAFDLAQGSYLAFLDPQDYWIHDKLSRQVGFMMRFGAPLSHTSYAFGDDKCHLLNIGCYHISGDFNLLNYKTKNPACISTLMINKERTRIDFEKYEEGENSDLMTFFLKNGLISAGLTDVMTLCRPVFDKKTQTKIDGLIRDLLLANPDDKTTALRVVEHHAYSAKNVDGLKLDPSVCIGHEVVTSMNKLRNFKI